MTAPFAARIDHPAPSAIASLRLHPGIEVCQTEDSLWLRGDDLDEPTRFSLRKIAPTATYTVLPDASLVPLGHRLPQGYLPQGQWLPLNEWLAPQIQPAALPGQPAARIPLRLVPGGSPEQPNILITPLEQFADYAQSAPSIRLACLHFAANASDAVIRGSPLPPLPGHRCIERAGIATPCGWTWHPPLEADLLRSLLRLSPGDLALLSPDGYYEHIPAEAFVPAHRSAVRLSLKGPSHASD